MLLGMNLSVTLCRIVDVDSEPTLMKLTNMIPPSIRTNFYFLLISLSPLLFFFLLFFFPSSLVPLSQTISVTDLVFLVLHMEFHHMAWLLVLFGYVLPLPSCHRGDWFSAEPTSGFVQFCLFCSRLMF